MQAQGFKFDLALSQTFLGFQEELYCGEPDQVPMRGAAALAPFGADFEFHASKDNDHRNFIIRSNGRIAGHVTASTSFKRRDRDGSPVGAVGHFECVDDAAVAEALLAPAVAWLKNEQGVRRVIGPMNFDIWHGYRFMTSGFGEPPFPGEPRNKAYYPHLFERFGFRPLHEWNTIEVVGREEVRAVAQQSEHRYREAVAAGYRFRPLEPDNADDRRTLYGLEAAAFRTFAGYTPLSFRAFEAQFAAYARLIPSWYLSLGLDPRGGPVAFTVAYAMGPAAPRVAQDACSSPRSSDSCPGQWRTEPAVFYMIGVSPNAAPAPRGLGRAILHFTLRQLMEAGYDRVLAALITDEAVGRAVFGAQMRQKRRTYALYELSP